MLYVRAANSIDLEKEWQFVKDMPADENGLTNEWPGITKKEFEKTALPEEEFYLRVNKDNPASLHVMQNNGGKVYGIPLPEGGVHCYNMIGSCVFDLTCEQFGDRDLSYENNPEQLREEQFSKEEKRIRYENLKSALRASLADFQ